MCAVAGGRVSESGTVSVTVSCHCWTLFASARGERRRCPRAATRPATWDAPCHRRARRACPRSSFEAAVPFPLPFPFPFRHVLLLVLCVCYLHPRFLPAPERVLPRRWAGPASRRWIAFGCGLVRGASCSGSGLYSYSCSCCVTAFAGGVVGRSALLAGAFPSPIETETVTAISGSIAMATGVATGLVVSRRETWGCRALDRSRGRRSSSYSPSLSRAHSHSRPISHGRSPRWIVRLISRGSWCRR